MTDIINLFIIVFGLILLIGLIGAILKNLLDGDD